MDSTMNTKNDKTNFPITEIQGLFKLKRKQEIQLSTQIH